ncbi:prolipoprotein diacylglyceryl transferase [Cumulibacter manganitolerans]|uniref:prolipoprotein diacylglyceryl transferase n=1 Tax=Cumulibacter manganitolerans TaxID=1884992 RepID=UPI001296C5CD|nr:prolipoprotein diacylglyceryl transferase [Cumulibacter manganitolerans]
MTVLATLPSPTQNQIDVFGIPLRAYALCILAGILLAIWLSNRRWVARGGKSGEILDLALWAVPFGIIGGRIYHVLSTPGPYFGKGGDPVKALYIWEGGLGIWGAIALGGVGAWIGARRMKLRMTSIADTLAPGLIFAQAIGRLGNWFNNELYGGPDKGPLGLEIHQLDASGKAPIDPATGKANVIGTFQPTFLYELVWNALVGGLLLWIDRRYKMGRGRLFAAYVALYCLGRFFIENMRSDYAVHVLGLRINVWTSIIVGLGAVAYLIVVKGTREPTPYTDDRPAFVTADDVSATPDATPSTPDATSSTPEGTSSTPDATPSTPEGTSSAPEGTSSTLEGTSSTVEATSSTVVERARNERRRDAATEQDAAPRPDTATAPPDERDAGS